MEKQELINNIVEYVLDASKRHLDMLSDSRTKIEDAVLQGLAELGISNAMSEIYEEVRQRLDKEKLGVVVKVEYDLTNSSEDSLIKRDTTDVNIEITVEDYQNLDKFWDEVYDTLYNDLNNQGELTEGIEMSIYDANVETVTVL